MWLEGRRRRVGPGWRLASVIMVGRGCCGEFGLGDQSAFAGAAGGDEVRELVGVNTVGVEEDSAVFEAEEEAVLFCAAPARDNGVGEH
jgi:hypothetical protein